MLARWTWLVLLMHLMKSLSALPDGAPESACYLMKPGTQAGQSGMEGHLAAAQNIVPTWGNTKTPPYHIQVHDDEYSPNEKIRVSVVANQTIRHNLFKGLMLQARILICNSDGITEVESEPTGTFQILPGSGQAGNSLLKTMNCENEDSNTVTHKSPQFKINETIEWTAPDSMVGHIVFKATIVQHAHIYWTDVYSHILVDGTEGEPSPCSSCNLIPKLMPLILASIYAWLVGH